MNVPPAWFQVSFVTRPDDVSRTTASDEPLPAPSPTQRYYCTNASTMHVTPKTNAIGTNAIRASLNWLSGIGLKGQFSKGAGPAFRKRKANNPIPHENNPVTNQSSLTLRYPLPSTLANLTTGPDPIRIDASA